ncbi:hypothetical protein UlMin_035010 [Ulmus minor]
MANWLIDLVHANPISLLDHLRLKLASTRKPLFTDPIETPLLQKKIAGASGKWSIARLVRAILFGVNLEIMSFNGGVFVAIILGLTIGYLFFRSRDEDVSIVVDNPCARA